MKRLILAGVIAILLLVGCEEGTTKRVGVTEKELDASQTDCSLTVSLLIDEAQKCEAIPSASASSISSAPIAPSASAAPSASSVIIK